MRILYTLTVYLYVLVIRMASLFNKKAKSWIEGRKNVFSELGAAVNESSKVIWFHCASLGEFEQGRPVMDRMKEHFPDHMILLTFFSPSGYEVRKDTDVADHVCYLPADTPHNVSRFIEIAKPEIAIFVKYEFWFNYIHGLNRRKIPVVVISAIFRPSQYFFRSYGKWPLRQLKKVDQFFVQDGGSEKLLQKAGIDRVVISGDTRFDRVRTLATTDKRFPLIEKFKKNQKLLLAGSTWPADEELLVTLIEKFPSIKLVIAPHETGEERIDQLANKFKNYSPLRYSHCSSGDDLPGSVLIIDSIGFLSYLYRYATIAYIGGGFGAGIHNLLEAVTYGVPVLFGPKHDKFKEASDLTALHAGFPVSDDKSAAKVIRELFSKKEFYNQSSKAAKKYVETNAGASDLILNKLEELI